MGRKGVGKQKRVKGKIKPPGGKGSATNERKAVKQPEQVTEKSNTWPKDNRKR